MEQSDKQFFGDSDPKGILLLFLFLKILKICNFYYIAPATVKNTTCLL